MRELYSLIGDSVPTLAAQFNKRPPLKQKPHLGVGQRSVSWEWQPFTNEGRADGLRLSHWTKTSAEPAKEYPYAKYNVQSTVYSYTEDEYTRFLDDPGWTKEETDYLFALVKDYSTRWYVVHDRYEFLGGPTRVLDDLKDRYFTVCKKLIRTRPWEGDEASKASLLATMSFDKDRELHRKNYIAGLETRTQDQLFEEEALYTEIRRLEQTERRFRKDRDALLRMISGIESGLPEVVEDDSPFGSGLSAGLSMEPPKKKKKGNMDIDSPVTPNATIALPPAPAPLPFVKRPSHASPQDIANCIVRTEPTLGTPYKATHQGAHLRSYKLPQPKGANGPRVIQAFQELGVSSSRMVMYTRENLAHFEGIYDSVNVLLDIKKAVDKVEQDIRVAKTRLGMAESSELAGPSSVAGDGDLGMDVDEDAEGEADEDGRAQSVMSARSTRSRKQSRRSSISSVDTNTARGTTKRQKKS